MNWYLKVLKQYVDFDGRARRKEYWMFTLMNGIIGLVLQWGTIGILESAESSDNMTNLVGLGIPIAYSILVFLPTIAVSVRRMHDVGKSGWMVLINLIPLIGSIWYFVLSISDSQMGDNQYGPNPKLEEFQP